MMRKVAYVYACFGGAYLLVVAVHWALKRFTTTTQGES